MAGPKNQNKTLKLNKFQEGNNTSSYMKTIKRESWLIYLSLLILVVVLYVQKENEVADISSMIRLKDDDIKNKDSKITSLEEEKASSNDKIKSLETERDTIKGENNALQQQVDKLTKKLETAHEKVDNIHVALKGLHDHFQDLTEEDDEKEEGSNEKKDEIKLLSFDVDMVDGVLSHEIILQTIQDYITKAVVNFLNNGGDEDFKDILDKVELVYIDKEEYKVGGAVKFKTEGVAKYPKTRDIHNLQIHALEDTKALDAELKKAKEAAGDNNDTAAAAAATTEGATEGTNRKRKNLRH